jgi:hypothetical protein
MDLNNQGLTRDERQLLSHLFGELSKSNLTRPVSEIQEKAYYEVIARSVESFQRDLGDVFDGQSVFPLLEA